MSTVPPIQDMPPTGGYSKIHYERVPAKVMFSGGKIIAAFVVMQFTAIYLKYTFFKPIVRRNEVEMRSSMLALMPFLSAEKDRASLLQIRKSRDAEEELMKDVEGWEVGTLMGEPIYKTLDTNEWTNPKTFEYFTHAPVSDYNWHHNCLYRR